MKKVKIRYPQRTTGMEKKKKEHQQGYLIYKGKKIVVLWSFDQSNKYLRTDYIYMKMIPHTICFLAQTHKTPNSS